MGATTLWAWSGVTTLGRSLGHRPRRCGCATLLGWSFLTPPGCCRTRTRWRRGRCPTRWCRWGRPVRCGVKSCSTAKWSSLGRSSFWMAGLGFARPWTLGARASWWGLLGPLGPLGLLVRPAPLAPLAPRAPLARKALRALSVLLALSAPLAPRAPLARKASRGRRASKVSRGRRVRMGKTAPTRSSQQSPHLGSA